MARSSLPTASKRSIDIFDDADIQQLPPKRVRTLTQKARESALAPFLPPNAQLSEPAVASQEPIQPLRRLSLCRDMAVAASQEPEELSWESQLRNSMAEDTFLPPAEGSQAATEATSEIVDDMDSEERFWDNFEGIDWARLKGFSKPLTTPLRKKSWIFRHGYRVAMTSNADRLFFICRYCHQRRLIDCGGPGKYEVTTSTSAAINHLSKPTPGHSFSEAGKLQERLPKGQLSIRNALKSGIKLSQEAVNELGHFDVQGFRMAAVGWLVDNNHPLREFETPAFRQMLRLSNPESEQALWKSHNSVSTFVMKVYSFMKPQVVRALSNAVSKIHISFDGWTAKGGKRGFLGIVAHFASTSGDIHDLRIALPQLTGTHSGEKIAEVVAEVLNEFGVDAKKLGCFVLDNAYSNDAAVDELALKYDFDAVERRLRCGCHVINLVGQQIIFGRDKDSYNNAPSQSANEAEFMRAWRQDGPLGVFFAAVNYIKTPLQHDIYENFQRSANKGLPDDAKTQIKEPVKPVITRWNSYCASLERGVEQRLAMDLYIDHHTRATRADDEVARRRGKAPPTAPDWMRCNGLTAADWQVITEYLAVLQPLKLATKRLEGRGKSGRFGAIYEVIPIFEHLLNEYEQLVTTYEAVDYNAYDAPEDHLAINLRAAWSKLSKYYLKLDDSPYYFIATLLHPYYKTYFEIAWQDDPSRLKQAYRGFQRVWQQYKPQETLPKPVRATTYTIDDAIEALLNKEPGKAVGEDELDEFDEYEHWRQFEPRWQRAKFDSQHCETAVGYWLKNASRYPNLSRLAVDVLTIPASSCECERMFSELGDLLEPRRRNISSELLAALNCIKCWTANSFETPQEQQTAAYTDEEMNLKYHVEDWETETC